MITLTSSTMTDADARKEIRRLLRTVESSEKELAERASRFALTEREAAVWGRVSALRRLLRSRRGILHWPGRLLPVVVWTPPRSA